MSAHLNIPWHDVLHPTIDIQVLNKSNIHESSTFEIDGTRVTNVANHNQYLNFQMMFAIQIGIYLGLLSALKSKTIL
jgi:hypothetical protein